MTSRKTPSFYKDRDTLELASSGASERARQTGSDSGDIQPLVAVAPDLPKTEALEDMPGPMSESPAQVCPRYPLELRATPPFRPSPESAVEEAVNAEVGVTSSGMPGGVR